MSVRRFVTQTWPGLAGVALLTGLLWFAKLNYASAGFLYLLVVLFHALNAGALSSVIVCFCAALSLDFFFVPPVLTWRITDPIDAAALLTYTVTAFVVAYMASKVRKEAGTAKRHERELRLLFSSASQLLALEPEAIGRKYLEILRESFALRSICVYDASTGECEESGKSTEDLPALTKNCFLESGGVDDRVRAISLRCVRVGGTVTGAVGLEGCSYSPWVAGAISVLVAATRERAQNVERAIKSAAEARAEALRSAILDAFAHEFKTPLTAIMAAAGGLQEVGPLNAEQLEMSGTIEEQTAWLAKLTTRLLRAARLDREEVKPRLQPADLKALLGEVVASRAALPQGDRLDLVSMPEPVTVMADIELLTLGLVPVLDNALKYSKPATRVVVSATRGSGMAEIRVTSDGDPIPPSDRQRIFDRFQRGTAEHASHAIPGSGLGLYIAKKILKAHGGDIALDETPEASRKVTFALRLPLVNLEEEYAREN